MKGVILAGGSGSRLMPLTKVTNKHLLSIWNRPMIFYPLQTLASMEIEEVLVVSGLEHCGHISQLLGSGSEFGVDISYRIQDKAGGIAQALNLAKGFVGMNDTVAVILGDNIFEDKIVISDFYSGARFFLKETDTPERFGVAQVIDNHLVNIEEKPKEPKSNLAVTGLYLFDYRVFEFIKNIKPSKRGELEITDINNKFIQIEEVSYQILKGQWTDAGTFESLFHANEIARNISKNGPTQ